jgi:biotin carboxylase
VPWNPQAIVTQSQEILTSDEPVCETLISYVFQVLDAVGLFHGPCHTEVMLTPRGPILVEVNARMHGVQGPLMIEKATGTGLASYVADAAMDGWNGDGGLLRKHLEAGRASTHRRWMYPRRKCAGITMLISHAEGILKADVASQVSALNLPSVAEVFPSVKPGALLRQTIDLNTNAGYAVMLHSSAKQMDKDIAAIRAAEESGSLYPVTSFESMSRQISPLSACSSPACRQVSPSLEKAEELWDRSLELNELNLEQDIVISGLVST